MMEDFPVLRPYRMVGTVEMPPMLNRRDFLTASLNGGAAILAGSSALQAARSAPPVKIAAVEPLVLHGRSDPGARPWVWTRLRTDQGVTGYGECYAWMLERGKLKIPGIVREIGEQIEGGSAVAIEAFRQRFWSQGSNLEWFAALATIEIAMWDVLGQVAGLPVHALLGGKVRDRIPVYANHSTFTGRDTASRVESAVQAREMGFRFFKWDPFVERGGPPARTIEREVEQVRAIHEAVAPSMRIAIDAHGRYTSVESAIAAAQLLEPFDPLFFEEPTQRGRPELLPDVAAETSIPLAVGEMHRTVEEAKEWLDTRAVRVLQPEVGNDGGILETYLMAMLADAYGVKVAPHGWVGPVAVRAATQVCAAVPNLLLQEYPGSRPDHRWTQDLIDPAAQIVDGELVVPEGPGLGFRVVEKELERIRID